MQQQTVEDTLSSPAFVPPMGGSWSSIPHASKYANEEVEAANRRFDDRLIVRMGVAKNWAMWGEIFEILLRAKGNKNLRPAPREFFFSHCPHAVMVAELRKVTGCPAGEKKIVSTDNGERAKSEARRAANRALRHAAEAPKGPSGGGGARSTKNKGGKGKK